MPEQCTEPLIPQFERSPIMVTARIVSLNLRRRIAPMRAAALLVLTLLFALALAACGGSSSPTATAKPAAAAGAAVPGSFVGAVPGTDALLAITTKAGSSLSYVCDSKQIASWFKGPVAANALDLTAANGDHLKATLSATGATGTLTMAGKDFPFTAAPSTGDTGLFRADQSVNGMNVVGGWIINADGQQRGAVHGIENDKDRISAVPQLVVTQKAANNTWTVTHPTFGPLTVARVDFDNGR
jgi:hypothetical protein